MDSSVETHLNKQVQTLSWEITEQQIGQLFHYLCLLQKWNKAYNLTAVRDPYEMVDRHIIDSLSVVPYINQQTDIIDVGSGPGLPGIPIAICCPELKVTTLDSNGKKTRFQNEVKAALALTNLTVVKSRAEEHADAKYHQVISRAFASLQDMLKWTSHLALDNGLFFAMKGLYPEEEVSKMPSNFILDHCLPLQVSGAEGERHLLKIRRV